MTQVRKQAICGDMSRLVEPRFFRALCDPNRIALLARLAQCKKPCSVSQLAACCPTDLSVVSRHLAMLRDAGILRSEKRGKEVLYSVCYDELVRTLRALADAFEACCGSKTADAYAKKTTALKAHRTNDST